MPFAVAFGPPGIATPSFEIAAGTVGVCASSAEPGGPSAADRRPRPHRAAAQSSWRRMRRSSGERARTRRASRVMRACRRPGDDPSSRASSATEARARRRRAARGPRLRARPGLVHPAPSRLALERPLRIPARLGGHRAGELEIRESRLVEVDRVDRSRPLRPTEQSTRLVEDGALDPARDVGRELVRVRVGTSIADRLKESPVARRLEIVLTRGAEREARADPPGEEIDAMRETRHQLSVFVPLLERLRVVFPHRGAS